jgi:hypothetical protein
VPVLYFIMIHLVLKKTLDDVGWVSIASGSINSAVFYEGLVVRMVVCFSFGVSQFMEKMHMCLKGVTVVW